MLECFESVQESFDELQASSITNLELKMKLVPINQQLLLEIIKLLKPFRTVRQKLCSNSVPTFHDVAVIKQFLLIDHLDSTSDLSAIKTMKKRMKKWTTGKDDKFPVTVDHLCASFLHPGLKKHFFSKYHDQSKVSEARKHLVKLLSMIDGAEKTVCEPTPEKRTKNDDILAPDYTKNAISDRYPTNEIEAYRLKPVKDEELNENPIFFWNRNSDTFPKLSKIARNLLSIPATSVKSEQNFSAAGRVVNDRRIGLKSDTINSILFVKSNFQ